MPWSVMTGPVGDMGRRGRVGKGGGGTACSHWYRGNVTRRVGRRIGRRFGTGLPLAGWRAPGLPLGVGLLRALRLLLRELPLGLPRPLGERWGPREMGLGEPAEMADERGRRAEIFCGTVMGRSS